MKFVIFGAGGTGGVLGAYLASSGEDVTFIARGAHGEAIKKNGLTVKTSHRGDIVIKPAKCTVAEQYQGEPDVIFVCVKYYALESAVAFVKKAANENTIVIPILNVFGTGGIMQRDLPGITVLDGCIYVFGSISAPGIINQPQKLLRVFYGYRPDEKRNLEDKAKALEPILQKAGINGHYSENILVSALTKFAFISPMGAAGLYYGATSGDFQHEGEVRDLFVGLIKEATAIGKAMGLTFDRDLVENGLKMIDNFAPGLDTSLQRDVAAGGSSEFTGLITRIVELGAQYNVPVPLYTKVNEWGKAHGLA